MIRLLRHKTTWTKIISILSVVIFAGLLITVAAILLSDRQRVMDNNTRLVEIYGELYKQTEDQGIDPTTPDPGQVEKESQQSVVGPRGAAGSPGQSGRPPTASEIQEAVNSYCSNGKCMGTRGQDGAAGQDSVAPGPQGAAGKDSTIPGPQGIQGIPGKDGADSSVPGPIGPVGPAGADSVVPGPAGASGVDGRGIESITCDGTGLDIRYSDGTSSLVALPGGCVPL